MVTTSEVELFRRRLSRGLFAWNVGEIMRTISEDPKVLTNCGRTLALQQACDMDRNSVSVELIRLLIEEGSRQNFGERGGLSLPLTDFGSAPLQMLVKRGSLKVLKYLSESQPPLLCKEDVSTFELLHFATCHGHVDVVQFLLNLDPDAIYRRNHQGTLPIHMTGYSTCNPNPIREMFLKYHLKHYNDTQQQNELIEWVYPTDRNFTNEEIFSYVQDIASILNRLNVSIPILSSAICAGASHSRLLQIMRLFEDSVKIRDFRNRLPIHYAAELGIGWHSGMRDIFYANPNAIIDLDSKTTLTPVILAACNNGECSLDSIFELMSKYPESIAHYTGFHK